MQNVLIVLAAIIYILSPYDILPDFLVGWGWLDDLVVLLILIRFFNKLKLGARIFKGSEQYTQQQSNDGTYNQQYQKEKSNEQQPAGDKFKQKDPYDILGISKNADNEEIKQAYRKLANQYHPDKLTHLGEEFRALAEERFKTIQEAYQTLEKNKSK